MESIDVDRSIPSKSAATADGRKIVGPVADQRRTDSRLERRRPDERNKVAIDGVHSGEQVLDQPPSSSKKHKQLPDNYSKYLMPVVSSSQGGEEPQYYNESYQLLEKLMENLRGNPALQNVYIR